MYIFSLPFFFLMDFERERSERDRNMDWLPNVGTVTREGFEPTTWCMGLCSNQLSDTGQALFYFKYIFLTVTIFGCVEFIQALALFTLFNCLDFFIFLFF